MSYRLSVAEMANGMLAAAYAKCKARRVSKKTIRICNGYLLERCKPSGAFKVYNEVIKKSVYVDSFSKAKKIAINNSKME